MKNHSSVRLVGRGEIARATEHIRRSYCRNRQETSWDALAGILWCCNVWNEGSDIPRGTGLSGPTLGMGMPACQFIDKHVIPVEPLDFYRHCCLSFNLAECRDDSMIHTSFVLHYLTFALGSQSRSRSYCKRSISSSTSSSLMILSHSWGQMLGDLSATFAFLLIWPILYFSQGSLRVLRVTQNALH